MNDYDDYEYDRYEDRYDNAYEDRYDNAYEDRYDNAYEDRYDNAYEDRYEDDYKYYEDQEEFGVGYRHLEQVGMPQEEDELIETRIIGRGQIQEIEKKIKFTGMNSYDKFLAGFHALMLTVDIQDLEFNAQNKKELIDNIKNVTFIQLKNPLYYILGYYLHDCVPPQMSAYRKEKIQNIKKILGNNYRIRKRQQNEQIIINQMFADVIKYARFWQINNLFIIK